MKTLLDDTLIKILSDGAKNITIDIIIYVFFAFIALLKTYFFGKRRVLRGKYLHFKTIRKEYLEDNINGYFVLKQYFSRNFSLDEMEYILNSPEAYEIFFFLRTAGKKCEFKGNKYISTVRKRNYILPFIGYSISFLLLTIQIALYNEMTTGIGLHYYCIILIFNICLSGPLLITSLMSIGEIADARKLDKIINRKEKKDTKCFLSCFKKIPLLRCKNAKEKNAAP
jgi:hypothetical protein